MSRAHRITLKTGEIVLVDVADKELVSEYRWHRGGTKNRYAATNINGKTTYLHRLLLGASTGDIVDHIDGNPHNCRRKNLRFVTHSQNSQNRAMTDNPFGFRGVVYRPTGKKYQAYVQRNGLTYRGPRRERAEDAARDWDDMARGLFGEYTTYNFPREGELQVKVRGAS